MKRTTTGFSISPELLEWLRLMAKKNGLSLSSYVNMQLLQHQRSVEGDE